MRALNSCCIRGIVVAGWVLLALAITARPAHAQIETGLIVGTITDESGGALPGVTVTVQNLSTGQKRTTVTGPEGQYRVAALQASKYSVRAELSGFQTVVRPEITVNIASAVDVNLVMTIGGVQEVVEVKGEAPIVESTKTSLGNVVTQTELQTLPSKQRAFLDFTLLMPATVENVSMDGGTGAVIGGARTVEGVLLVDGFYNMDESFANAKQRHSQDVIQEFQVLTFGGSAEYGRAIGGVVNAITKSGGNTLTGTAYGYFRNTSLNAQDFGEAARGVPKSTYDRQQWGGTLGGPVVHDKSFFFGAYERTVENWPVDNGISASVGAIIGLPAADVGTVPRYFHGHFAFGKFDQQITENQRIQGTVSWSHNQDHQIGFAVRPVAARSAAHIQHTTDLAFLGKWTMVASHGTMLHELKVSYFPRNYYTDGLNEGGPPLVPDGQINTTFPLSNSSPARVVITSVAQFGSVSLNNVINTTPVEAIYTSTKFVKQHTWKFGADYMDAPYRYERYSSFVGVYTFPSLAAYQKGLYSTYVQSFGNPSNDRSHQYISGFVQDTWQPAKRFSMNYGVRYDVEFNPKAPQNGQPYGNDYNNFGPRFGLSYDLTGKGKTFLKVVSGIYYDRIWGNSTLNFYSLKGYQSLISSTWTPTTSGAPVYPAVFVAMPANLPASTRDAIVMPDQVKVPADGQVVATLEHSVSRNFAIKGSVIYSRSWDKEYTWDTNLVWDDALQKYTRPDPNWRRVTQYRYGGASEYEGGIVEVNLRGARIGLDGSITLARAYQTPATKGGAPNSPKDGIMSDWGPVMESPTFRGVVSGWYNIIRNVQFSSVFSSRSGFAVNPVAAAYDLNGDAVFGDRTPGFKPFSFRLPWYTTVDMRLSWAIPFRRAKATLYAEGFNILNGKFLRTVLNDYGPDPAHPGPNWLQPSTYFAPRNVQLGLRLGF
jgi:hypothetical protein